MLTEKYFSDKTSLFTRFFSQLLPTFLRWQKSGATPKSPIRRITRDYPPARQILGIALALGLTALSAQAQSFQGALRGIVKDKESNFLPGVTLTLTQLETNVTRTTVTNDTGAYVFERVDPGKYKLSANSNGFKKADRADVLVEPFRSFPAV